VKSATMGRGCVFAHGPIIHSWARQHPKDGPTTTIGEMLSNEGRGGGGRREPIVRLGKEKCINIDHSDPGPWAGLPAAGDLCFLFRAPFCFRHSVSRA
jgi:hypothetical protein